MHEIGQNRHEKGVGLHYVMGVYYMYYRYTVQVSTVASHTKRRDNELPAVFFSGGKQHLAFIVPFSVWLDLYPHGHLPLKKMAVW